MAAAESADAPGWGPGPRELPLPLDTLPWAAEEPPSSWGPRAWYWLHAAAISYPASPPKPVHRAMHVRLWAFLRSLPCAACRGHALAYARAHPPALDGSREFQTWAWKFHNAVNRRLGKPHCSPEEYREIYQHELGRAYWPYLS